MPKFTVKYHYIVDHYGTVETEAIDAETAQKMVLSETVRDEYEWSNTSTFEFLGVDETPIEAGEDQTNEVS